MKKTFFLILLLLLTIGCGQNDEGAEALPTVAVVATLPPLPEGANGVVVVGEGMSDENVAEQPIEVEPEQAVEESEAVAEAVESEPESMPTMDLDARAFGYTYQTANGNRNVTGPSTFPDVEPIDVPLNGTPKWITAVTDGVDVVWAVVLEDGTVQAFRADTEAVVEVTDLLSLANLAETPPLLYVQEGVPEFVTAPTFAVGATHPVLLSDDVLVYSLLDGGVVVGNTTLDVTALPDGRILTDNRGRLLLLTDPTDRYAHGVLGDDLEAGSITLIETEPETAVVNTITIPEPQVIEGIMPLWVDWNGDGTQEIIVTLSDANQGAQIVLFNEAGEQIATGPAIGQGGRWRHQLSVAPFGPNGEMELVDVLTPHIGGVVEFYQWNGDTLEIVAKVPGFTSHVIGTNNLDMAVVGDFNGDEQVELLLPTQDRTQLGGIQRTADGANVLYQVPVDGKVVTNLAGATMITGQTAVAVGRDDGFLRIWQP